MNSSRIFILIGSFIIFTLVQVLILKNLVLFGVAFCFLHVLFILLLPIETKTIPSLLIAFGLGLMVDLFYDTIGIHTASLLIVAFIKKPWIKILTPTGGYDDNLQPSMLNMGFGWFATFSVPLFLIYNIAFFFIESLGTDLFIPVVQKIIASTIFVFVMSIIVQLLFYRRRRGI
ncbi:rod shape-determining protein MreD [Belliella pelovolcani]|uniref:Rod shape-determining protein MreD n=1 Tax=Belliella pelovolcani TaxID=529505 RepID=A0A1N7N5F5_9BACT|nr:rod shape-determining protein MreD [Belliella pelovolcani]SIS93592.1 rod shape-determining protein MreD [Belliella pelovolcani]